ncbi:MAG: hypothetical protein IKI58_06290 [Oscillospiraceae bacterium]|nr:hypothetical protein [Oscillospiraceae bacterium]
MSKMVLKRKVYAKMLEWKAKYVPEYALFIKDARRVGQTSIAEGFGKNEYKYCITISSLSASDIIRYIFKRMERCIVSNAHRRIV